MKDIFMLVYFLAIVAGALMAMAGTVLDPFQMLPYGIIIATGGIFGGFATEVVQHLLHPFCGQN